MTQSEKWVQYLKNGGNGGIFILTNVSGTMGL